jgi:ABC-type dipeptide/oligopeptide/nickel transport system permease component
MARFLISRAISLIFVLFAVSFITFIIGYLAPGDPIFFLLGQHYTPALHAQISHAYGLDLPWWQQYYHFVVNALRGNFGYSYQYRDREVWEILKPLIPTSMELAGESLILALLMGIPAGIFAALRQNTIFDTGITTIMLLLYIIPDFVLIIIFQVLMVWLIVNKYPALPVAGWDSWQSRIGPVLIAASTSMGYYARLTRTALLEVLGQDYIRTARAKGLQERAVISLHALRNASLPLITVIGPSLGYLVTGLYFAEVGFNIPGIAAISVNAIFQFDYPVIQATGLIFSAAVVVGNAISDVLYVLADPRIKLE